MTTIDKEKYSGLYSVPLFSHVLNMIDELNSYERSAKICDVYDRMPQRVEASLFSRILEALCSDGKIAFDGKRNQFFVNDILKYDPKKFLLLKKKYGSSKFSGIVAHPSHYGGFIERIDQHIRSLEEGDRSLVEFLERTLSSNPAIFADRQFYDPKKRPKINFEKVIRDCASKKRN